MSSCRQWKIGSEVKSSAKMHPIAQMSGKSLFCLKIQQPEVREVMEKWIRRRLATLAARGRTQQYQNGFCLRPSAKDQGIT